ncbi:MAG TPA: amidohydrolase family protein [Thermoanaerobaculia bacterium]|nr:amidohydrolase family protein [Thermoanaerobaculia bacterium]
MQRSLRRLIPLALLALALGGAAGPAPAAPPEVRYVFLLSGNRAGSATAWTVSGREQVFTFEYNDRGRGVSLTTREVMDEQGVPVRVEISGSDYWKNPVTETFEQTGDRAVWSNAAEKGERTLSRPAFYLGFNTSPLEGEVLARALLRAPGGRIDLLPAGEMRLAQGGSLRVSAQGASRTVELYSLTGRGFEPDWLWLAEDHRLFAWYDGWTTLIREGWESAVPDLVRTQESKNAERIREDAARLAHRPAGPWAIRGARLFDPATGAVRPDTTVIVTGNRITAVGQDGEVKIPAGAEVVDARGKFLMPGLWDMHTHLSSVAGPLNIAAGVTTVRDLANDIDLLAELSRSFDAGTAIGPRVIKAGIIDGPGPYAGPTKALVATEKDALAWVDRYADLGYVQIKLYSSLDPKLVPVIAKRAHERGLRLSGHIPNGMTAEQAVRAGYDEIQHVNFLFLNFLDGVDTRTPARFIEAGEHAAELNLGSPRVRSFIQLLKERGTVLDPTVNIFEDLFTARPGEIAPGSVPVAGRVPSQVQRGFRSGGLNPSPEKARRYADSFRKVLALVRTLHDAGVPIVPGTDALSGFALHRELELYVEAGLPPAEVLRMATLGSARVMKREAELGAVEPGKLADLILIDGDPVARISDVRRVTLTVKDGVVFDPAAVYATLGVKPAV